MVGGSCAWSSAALVSRILARATAGRRILAVWIPLLRLEVWVQEVSVVEVGAVTHVSKVLHAASVQYPLSKDRRLEWL